MTFASPLDSASSGLWWSNALYAVGSGLTVATALFVLYETRAVALGKRAKLYLASEIAVAISALLSLSGSLGAIHYSNAVNHLKDVALMQYEKSADLNIAQAKKDTAIANQNASNAESKAEESRQKAEAARAKAEGIRAAAEQARIGSLRAEADAQKAVIDKEKILQDNLQLQKQIEDERLARVQIEQRIAPRNLTKPAQDRLISELRPLKLSDVDIVIYAGNAEASTVASQLKYAFDAVGAKSHFFSPLGGSMRGIIIEYDAGDASATRGARSVADALIASQIQQILSPNLPTMASQLGAYSSDGSAGNAKIRILVGSK